MYFREHNLPEEDSADVIMPEEASRFNTDAYGVTGFQRIHAPSSDDTVGVTLGPVVGLVTDRTARILFETNAATAVSFSLVGRDYFAHHEHEVPAVTVQSPGCQPVTVDFTGLKPNFRYTIACSLKCFDLVDAHFRTLPCPKTQAVSLLDGPVKIAVVSGNDVCYIDKPVFCSNSPQSEPIRKSYAAQASEVSLWRDLYERIESDKIHMVLHVGNNVQIGGLGQTLFRDLAEQTNLTAGETYTCIQEEYRKVWNDPWCKHVLASCSNVMILGESDIGNLVARSASDSVEADAEDAPTASVDDFRVARAALRAYQCYQQALWSDAPQGTHDFAKHIPLTRYLSLLLIDFCVAPTFYGKPFQETNGFMELQRALEYKLDASQQAAVAPGGGDQRGLLVVSSARICDSTSVTHHYALRDDLSAVLGALFEWKMADSSGMREVAIVSAASRSSGYENGTYTIQQKGANVTIEEWAVGAMSVGRNTAGRGWFRLPSWLKPKKQFSDGLYTFRTDASASRPSYGVLTFGGLLGQTGRSTGELSERTHLVPRATFWMETFDSQRTSRVGVHVFTYVNDEEIVKRVSLTNTTRTSPLSAPSATQRIVWRNRI